MLYINRELAAALPPLLDAAARSINITIYCMSPLTPTTHPRHRALTRALLDTKKRGLRCQAIIATLQPGTPGQTANNMSATMLKNAGWHVKNTRAVPLLHAKILIIDDNVALIGSHNWTDSALFTNHEATLSTDDKTEITRIQSMFDTLWSVATDYRL